MERDRYYIISFILIQAFLYILIIYTLPKSSHRIIEITATKQLNSHSIKRLAIYTPYALVPGGGEKYLLSSAVAFQRLGYEIDIFINDKNPCRTIKKLRELALSLRVPLKMEKVNIRLARVDNYKFKWPQIQLNYYTAFYLLGNEKFPQLSAIGSHLNIYMCQFPFDMHDQGSVDLYKNFASFQFVILNSRYTKQWYLKLIQPTIERREFIEGQNKAFPTVVIIHPPVEPFLIPFATPFGMGIGSPPKLFWKNETIQKMKNINIVMLGRFFRGRQNKGHQAALKVLQTIMTLRPSINLSLTMIGNVHPNEDSKKYILELEKFSAEMKLPVKFLANANPKDIEVELRKSLIIWHLTGIEQADSLSKVELFGNREDPASYEHFGIAIVEAMGAGCIPIALNKGGVEDIISDGLNGFLVKNSIELGLKTIFLLSLSKREQIELSQRAKERSEYFNSDKFYSKFQTLISRGVAAKVFTDFSRRATPILRQYNSNTKISDVSSAVNAIDEINKFYTAVIVETSISSTFELAVQSVLYRLSSWPILIFHSKENGNFVKSVFHFSNNTNLAFKELLSPVDDVHSYNQLLTSEWFWITLKDFGANKILLFQSDSVMLHGNIFPFLRYDYIGAPWDFENNEPIQELRNEGKITKGVGNGGFSIRSVSVMLEIISRFHFFEKLNEDVYFAISLETMIKGETSADTYKLADRILSYRFCREVKISSLLHPNELRILSSDASEEASSLLINKHSSVKPAPNYESSFFRFPAHLGLHAAWYYTSNDETIQLLEFVLSKYSFS